MFASDAAAIDTCAHAGGMGARPPAGADMLQSQADKVATSQTLTTSRLGWDGTEAEPEPEVFHPTETVEVICDPLSIQDWTALWDKLQPKIQTSVTYLARMVSLESTVDLSDGALVQTRTFDVAKGAAQ